MTNPKTIEAVANAISNKMEEWHGAHPAKIEARDYAQAAILAYEAAQWRPISEAPKDGAPILGYFGSTAGDEPPDMSVLVFHRGHWCEPTWPDVDLDDPTHFRPLPAPPKDSQP